MPQSGENMTAGEDSKDKRDRMFRKCQAKSSPTPSETMVISACSFLIFVTLGR